MFARRRAGSVSALLVFALLVPAFFLAPPRDLPAQDRAEVEPGSDETISGVVRDARSGNPLPGAFLFNPATERGTFSDDEGRFELPAEMVEGSGLMVRLLGYEDLLVGSAQLHPGVPVALDMERNPIALRGVEVAHDRFEARRNRVPFSVRVYEEEQLRTAPGNALDFVLERAHRVTRNCPASFVEGVCMRVRGTPQPLSIVVDERGTGWDAEMLRTMHPSELHMVEIYGGGRHIRAYTHQWMHRVAHGGRAGSIQLLPIFLGL